MTPVSLGRLIYDASVTHHTLLLMLLHQPLVIGVVEPVHNPKQIPSLPPVTTHIPVPLIIRIICIAAICFAVAPVVLCHITFAVYVAAVYVRNRGAAAFVCPAGRTWVEEVRVQRRSGAVVVLPSRVRRRWVVEAVGGGRSRRWLL